MQFLADGRQTCVEVLTKLGIMPDKYQIFNDIHGVEEAIGTDKRQLFLAGSFQGIQYQFPAFIQLLRDRNTKLVCVGYCYEILTGPFEETILRQLDYENRALSEVILNFQRGTLKRSSIRHEGRSFSYSHHKAFVEPVLCG